MKHRVANATATVIGAALWVGCAADAGYAQYEGDELETESTFGSAAQAVAACEGDDLQYDFNGFSASLAVAIANELRRWDVATDFVVSGGKLQLSATGSAMCGVGCQNIKALLLLQDDVTGGVPFHSPSIFRSKLTGWYQTQMTKLTELATASRLQPGTYRIKNFSSSKVMTVDAGSTADNALIEQWDNPQQAGAGDWTVSVAGTKHKFTNVRSGKCLDLQTDSSAVNTGLVQRTCATSPTQEFGVTKVDGGAYALMTRHAGSSLVTQNWTSSNDGRIVQDIWDVRLVNRFWFIQPVAGGANPANTLFKGMYALRSKNNTTKVMAVADSNENTLVRQATFSATNDGHQWYGIPNNGKYQFINRRSGKCLALLTDSATAAVGQKTCASNDNQKFTMTALGSADEYSFTTRWGKLLEVKDANSADGTVIQQVSGPADPHRRFILTPTIAGEPHRLSFSHSTDDGPCGAYKWYDITEPNGQPLQSPQESFIQLIFAGGKTALNGADENPFIAQVVSGGQVAIDPSGYMLGGNDTGTGSCLSTDILYDPTKTMAGLCCTRFNGVAGVLKVSTWSTTTFLCQ